MNFEAENDTRVEVSCSGTIRWYQYGKWHRKNGPTVVYPSGSKLWYQYGKLHRNNGPSCVYYDGMKSFFLEGIEFTEKTYWEKTNDF